MPGLTRHLKGSSRVKPTMPIVLFRLPVGISLTIPKHNKTFSRSQLMDEFWGIETETTLRAVDVYVTKLRDKRAGRNRGRPTAVPSSPQVAAKYNVSLRNTITFFRLLKKCSALRSKAFYYP